MNQETFIKRLCPQIELKYWRKRDLSIFTKGRRGFIVKIYQLGLLYGDGIGPEVVESAVKILRAASSRVGDTKFNIKELPVGWPAIHEYNSPLPEITKSELEKMDGWIMGPHDSVSYPEAHKAFRNPSGELRHHFGLYANIRPAKSIPGVLGVVNGADLVIFRENTEGFYTDRNMFAGTGEWNITQDIVISAGLFTRKAIERIAYAAFDMAMQRRKKVTIVHKSNVIKLGTGLFKDVCYEIAQQYPEVKVNDFHIDAMTAHLVRRISTFDIIVTENMFGDILSDLSGELVGSLGLSPSINTNDHQAMAQATHGAAPDIAGENIANPAGMILSTAMLLRWLSSRHDDENLNEIAALMESAVYKTVETGATTPDLGGSKSTTSFTEAIVDRIKK